MAYGPGGQPYTAKRGKAVNVSEYRLNITGAKAQSPLPMDDSSILLGFDGDHPTQSEIDSHLGTSSEFLAAAFDSTSIDADSEAIIIDLGGQVDELVYVELSFISSDSGATAATVVNRYLKPIAALQSSTAASECAKGANGNVAIKILWGNSPNFDGQTEGQIVVRVHWRAK
tara:strand:+ start:8153 stop:8668 length:516 start_codon:yes stop_codon:yes gene_type:complete